MTTELPPNPFDFMRGESPPAFNVGETIDVYYFGGPFSGWVGRFPAQDGQPLIGSAPVYADDASLQRVEGVYVLDGNDTEGRPLFRWEQRGEPPPDPDD